MALVKRLITVKFTLGEGQFGQSGGDTVTVEGLRVSAQINKSGGIAMAEATMRIWGLPLDIMNRLTVQNKLSYQQQRFNQVTILAGDEEGGMSVCFAGTISEAWADFNDMPDVTFMVTAQTGLYESAVPVPPISFNGQVDVVTMLSGIAAQMGKTLQNNGVAAKAVNPYYPGALLDQMKAVTRDAAINCDMDDTTITIWPGDGARDALTRLISPSTGMIGYPMFTQNSIAISMMFDPALAFGQIVRVESQLKPACGDWQIAAVSHNIESEMPGGGEWFTRLECGLFGHVTPIIT